MQYSRWSTFSNAKNQHATGICCPVFTFMFILFSGPIEEQELEEPKKEEVPVDNKGAESKAMTEYQHQLEQKKCGRHTYFTEEGEQFMQMEHTGMS